MTPDAVTVRSTPEAVLAVDELSGIINGPLLTHFDNITRQATVLKDPSNWDGKTALDFRDSVWPSYQKALNDAHQQLDTLRLRLGEIQADIQAAG
jgi:hypothetical protein